MFVDNWNFIHSCCLEHRSEGTIQLPFKDPQKFYMEYLRKIKYLNHTKTEKLLQLWTFM
jgi:hypothetical protein